jgi:hypothetical protein
MERWEEKGTAAPVSSIALARRKAAAEERVKAALAAIEEAQGLIGQAVQALCPVNGLCPVYMKVSRLYDQVNRAWYVVRDRAAAVKGRGKLTLDHDPDSYQGGRS